MPFTLIQGTFHVRGYGPDGDSLRFEAKNKANWGKLSGPSVKLNGRKHAQLRFEAIDALETHFTAGRGVQTHQPEELANAATDYVLEAVGIRDVEWGPTHGRVTSAKDGTAGYILTRAAERFRRPIAFVFGGTTNQADGSSVFLDVPLLTQSINYRLADAGLVHPTYYKGLFPDLRGAITEAVLRAWWADRGIWPFDWTEGVPVPNLAALEQEYIVMPKLFRRLASHLARGGAIRDFKQRLEQNPEPVLRISTGHITSFDTFIRTQDNTVKLTAYPEDLVFLS